MQRDVRNTLGPGNDTRAGTFLLSDPTASAVAHNTLNAVVSQVSVRYGTYPTINGQPAIKHVSTPLDTKPNPLLPLQGPTS